MRVVKAEGARSGEPTFRLLDGEGRPVREVDQFLRYQAARGGSPNTIEAYAYDLLHFYRFLGAHGAGVEDFSPRMSVEFFERLRRTPSRLGRTKRLSPTLVSQEPAPDGGPETLLAPSTVNRIMSCVSSFYSHLILLGSGIGRKSPIEKTADRALARVPERHRPFLYGVGGRRPERRVTRAKTVVRVPRPAGERQVTAIFGALKKLRDKAMLLLMLHGGLRPGEVLCLKLGDIQYGRRRVVVRFCEDHPKGARTKSRTERLVDLHHPETLATLSAYVMEERPRDGESPFVFLVGGQGKRRKEPLSYSALVKLFQRRCDELAVREPWLTPHSLRHTHATEMWEGGMRELALQKRLGHASPESTLAYTRVSDPIVLGEYQAALGRGRARPEGGRPPEGGHGADGT